MVRTAVSHVDRAMSVLTANRRRRGANKAIRSGLARCGAMLRPPEVRPCPRPLGPQQAAVALGNAYPVASLRAARPDCRDDGVVGPPYCVRHYVVDDRLGCLAGLAAARAALARQIRHTVRSHTSWPAWRTSSARNRSPNSGWPRSHRTTRQARAVPDATSVVCDMSENPHTERRTMWASTEPP